MPIWDASITGRGLTHHTTASLFCLSCFSPAAVLEANTQQMPVVASQIPWGASLGTETNGSHLLAAELLYAYRMSLAIEWGLQSMIDTGVGVEYKGLAPGDYMCE